MSRLDYDSVLQVKAGLRINRLIEDYAYRNRQFDFELGALH